MIKNIIRSFVLLIFFTMLLGIAYTLVISVIGNLVFPFQASGSLVRRDGVVIGSILISQEFTRDKYFHGRPNVSDKSNAPLSKEMFNRYSQSINDLKASNPQNTNGIPLDLIMNSGSTVDPDITPEGAYYQIPRISKATGIPPDKLKTLVASKMQDRFLKLYGQRRVNVLLLNIELDSMLNAAK